MTKTLNLYLTEMFYCNASSSQSSTNKKLNKLEVPTKPTDTIQQLRTVNTKREEIHQYDPIQTQNKHKQVVKVIKNSRKNETTEYTNTFT